MKNFTSIKEIMEHLLKGGKIRHKYWTGCECAFLNEEGNLINSNEEVVALSDSSMWINYEKTISVSRETLKLHLKTIYNEWLDTRSFTFEEATNRALDRMFVEAEVISTLEGK